jgi:predicted RNA binding protein YcfA (HicA-like mRNA interferase family)
MSGDEIYRILRQNGFVHARQRGSQAVMQKTLVDTTITIPVPLHPEVRIGTLLAIIRQSGLSRSLFED